MTKSELIEAVATRTKLPKKRAEEVVNSIFDSMTASLLREERIEIRGFGSFATKHYKPYRGRNPKTGQEVPITPRRVLVFRPSNIMKERINAGLSRRRAAE